MGSGAIVQCLSGGARAPISGLPPTVQEEARAAVVELKAAAESPQPEIGRLQRGVASLKRVMEGAAGNLVAAGVQAMIAGMPPAILHVAASPHLLQV